MTRPRQDWRALAIALIVLGCAACATVKQTPADPRLVEAQQAIEEGVRLEQAGRHAEAAPFAERALGLREAVLGSKHLDVAKCLNLLGIIYTGQQDYARAEQLQQRALAIREAVLGENHPDVAATLNNLAIIYKHQGLYAKATPPLLRALSIWEAAPASGHAKVCVALQNLANIYRLQGDHARAEPLLQRALAIREEDLGKNHPTVASALNDLVELYHEQGRYAQTEPLLLRALAIREATLDKNHPDIADSLHDLATLYMEWGNYARAEPILQRAIAIRETALGKNHSVVAGSLYNLAILYKRQGNYARAEQVQQRALEIRTAALGEKHPEVADSLTSLANLHMDQGHHERARSLFERALEIREAALGPKHHVIADSLHNLAALYMQQGDYARAEPLLQRAIVIWEAALGGNHPAVAFSLHNLATVYLEQGDYARAEPLYARSLAIREAALGRNHPEVAQTLYNMARLRLSQERLAEALPLLEHAFSISEEHLRQEVYGFSEERLTSALDLLRTGEESLYALVRAHPDDARIRHLALSAALLRKGRSVEEIAETSRIVYSGLGQAEREDFERLRALRTQLAELSLAGPGTFGPDDYQKRLEELTEQGDALEAALARSSAPMRALFALPPPSELVERVAATLPNDGALVEFVAYEDRPQVAKPGAPASQNPSQLRYLALLLFADGRTSAVDLGPAAAIDRKALRLHEALAGRYVSYPSAARALHAHVFRPLVPLLGKTKRLFLSPDSQLALVPFDALHDGRQFLADGFDITYLTSGKDLLPRHKDIPPARSVVVLADPDFESSPATSFLLAEAATGRVERSASIERFFSALRSEGSADYPWAPLPGTRQEAEAIHRMLPHSQLLMGRAATKDALLKLTTPGVLHIATHGFFLGDDGAPTGTRNVKNFGAAGEEGPLQLPSDPLLRSGLVLAGAHVKTGAGAYRREDSLVTALELAGLDLWGTQLVVLSACDTGRGEVKLGQGVYGLRRSLMVAGTQTLVTSLWKVDDGTTHRLMESYYRNLLNGQGRAEALRSAMRALRQKQPHPYYWAPFIAIGQDTPLQGMGSRDGSNPVP